MDIQREISIGKNLRRIRKELGLKQIEIVGEEVTRNLISMIEHEKSPMKYNVAQLVADNMNRICRERGQEVHIEPEDILQPERVEAKRQANQYIVGLKRYIDNKEHNLNQDFIEKIISFLNEWKIADKKVEIYELLAEISYLKGDKDWEYLYLNKALENYFLVPVKRDIHFTVRKLISNCVLIERYEEAFTLMKLDIVNKDNLPEDFKASILFNKALIYKKLKDYDKALEILDGYERYFEENNTGAFRMSLALKGSCYNHKQEYNKAIEVYKKIIDLFGEDSQEIGLIYSNIMNNYCELDLKEEVIRYKDRLLNILPDIEKQDNIYLLIIYSRLGKIFEYLDEIDLAEYYYIIAINKAGDKNDNDKSAKILFKLLNLYSKTNQQEKILLSNNIFKRGFENSELSNEMKLAFSLILKNIELGKEKIASSIINDVLKEGKENED